MLPSFLREVVESRVYMLSTTLDQNPYSTIRIQATLYQADQANTNAFSILRPMAPRVRPTVVHQVAWVDLIRRNTWKPKLDFKYWNSWTGRTHLAFFLLEPLHHDASDEFAWCGFMSAFSGVCGFGKGCTSRIIQTSSRHYEVIKPIQALWAPGKVPRAYPPPRHQTRWRQQLLNSEQPCLGFIVEQCCNYLQIKTRLYVENLIINPFQSVYRPCSKFCVASLWLSRKYWHIVASGSFRMW